MGNADLVIRPANIGDLIAVWPLVRDFATSYHPEFDRFEASFTTLISRDDTLVLVAEGLDGGIVGYLLASYHGTFFANGSIAWIEEVMVACPSRRTGVGAALMAEAEIWARGIPATYLSLATRRAADFYLSLGYEESAIFFKREL
jgi:GNAT superfamily N-acetyltransferase